MPLNVSARSVLAHTGKWGGRTTAALLFLFWGAFFVEHLTEWFLNAHGQYPPAWVWRQQFAHFAMLVALAMMLRWDRLGSLILVIATVGFFGGMRLNWFPFIALVNLIPLAFFSLQWIAGTRPTSPAQ